MMMAVKEKCPRPSCQKGQALFEFLVFIPLIFILLSLFMTIQSALNASINQQKFTRGFFYNIVQNDSRLPNSNALDAIRGDGVQMASIYAFGWKEASKGQVPLAPCFKIKTFFGNPSNEQCTPGETTKDTSQFIRVKTVYGVCGATYVLNTPMGYVQAENMPSSNPGYGASPAGCMNR